MKNSGSVQEWVFGEKDFIIKKEAKNLVAVVGFGKRVPYLEWFLKCMAYDWMDGLDDVPIDLSECRNVLIAQIKYIDDDMLDGILYTYMKYDKMKEHLYRTEHISSGIFSRVFRKYDTICTWDAPVVVRKRKMITMERSRIDGFIAGELKCVSTPSDVITMHEKLGAFMFDVYMERFGRKRIHDCMDEISGVKLGR